MIEKTRGGTAGPRLKSERGPGPPIFPPRALGGSPGVPAQPTKARGRPARRWTLSFQGSVRRLARSNPARWADGRRPPAPSAGGTKGVTCDWCYTGLEGAIGALDVVSEVPAMCATDAASSTGAVTTGPHVNAAPNPRRSDLYLGGRGGLPARASERTSSPAWPRPARPPAARMKPGRSAARPPLRQRRGRRARAVRSG